MQALFSNIKEKLFLGFIYTALVWVIIALAVDLMFIIMMYTGYEDKATQISNEIMWRIDGTFKNDPGNIWYNEDRMAIGKITNLVKIGPLAGSRSLEFGVKSILEEALQDKGYEIDQAAPDHIEIDIVYLDVLKTQSNMSVFHKDTESVVIRLWAKVYKEKKLFKKFMVEQRADEISMSTLVVDQGGKFNQTNLSSALKKAVTEVVNKL